MTRFSIVKIWYQNDWGRYGRRDERLTRALLQDDRVTRVVHLEPPVCCELLAADQAGALDPMGMTRRRMNAVSEGRLTLFTPSFAREDTTPLRTALAQVEAVFRDQEVFQGPALLWLSAPGVLGDAVLRFYGDRFRWILAELEDDHRHYHAERSEERLQIQMRYERAVRASDLVLSNSEALLSEFRPLQPRALRVPNAVDLTPFLENPAAPEWLERIPRPRITYVGNLRLRMRADLVKVLLEHFPQASFVFCGDGAADLRTRTGAPDNLITPGPIPWQQVPAVLQHSDVLLLPHQEGAVTEAMDPQKLYEYLASGRPVVATPVAGAREHAEVLHLASTVQDTIEKVSLALRETDPAAAERRRARVQGKTWYGAARQIVEAVLDSAQPGESRSREAPLQYFEHDRPELRALVPAGAIDVLDVGCGAGSLGRSLAFTRGCRVTGIELEEVAARRAAERLHEVLIGDALVYLRSLPDASFDAVLFADLLEHLQDPEQALQEARRLLRPGGTVVASLPNVRHWSVLRQVLEGDFRYEDAGILDRTHLRFFTRRSAERLFQTAGLEVVRFCGTRWEEDGIPPAIVEALRSFGLDVGKLLEESRDQQLLFVAQPAEQQARLERVSVVIPVCNAAEYTRRCLQELMRFSGERPLEIIVVDNDSRDETQQVLAEFPGVRVIRNQENRGFAGAVNQGWEAAGTRLVCVLNNDTLVTQGWLERLVDAWEREPRAGMVGPCTNYAKGRQQIDLGSIEAEADMRRAAREYCDVHRGAVEDVDFLSGFCFLTSRESLVKMGGLVEEYGPGTYEDSEICRRLRKGGSRLLVVRDAFVYHFGNRTFRTLGIDLEQQQRDNREIFIRRLSADPLFAAQEKARQGDWKGALEECREALRCSPVDLDALRLAGIALHHCGAPGPATRMLRRYLQGSPADPTLSAQSMPPPSQPRHEAVAESS